MGKDTNISYTIDRRNHTIHIESVSGNKIDPEMIEKEMQRYIKEGYIIDCSKISFQEGAPVEFIQIIFTMAEQFSGKKVCIRDLQTGLAVVKTVRAKVLNPNTGLLGL